MAQIGPAFFSWLTKATVESNVDSKLCVQMSTGSRTAPAHFVPDRNLLIKAMRLSS